MFFGFQDTKRMTQLFHSPNIDELMEAVSDGSRRKVRKQFRLAQPPTAGPEHARTAPSKNSRLLKAQQ